MEPDFEKLWAKYGQVMEATEPGKLDAIPLRALQKHYEFLCSLLPCPVYEGRNLSEQVLRRVEQLRDAMHAKRHDQTHGLGSKTLFWAKIAGIAAIIAATVAFVTLIVQTCSSIR